MIVCAELLQNIVVTGRTRQSGRTHSRILLLVLIFICWEFLVLVCIFLDTIITLYHDGNLWLYLVIYIKCGCMGTFRSILTKRLSYQITKRLKIAKTYKTDLQRQACQLDIFCVLFSNKWKRKHFQHFKAIISLRPTLKLNIVRLLVFVLSFLMVR